MDLKTGVPDWDDATPSSNIRGEEPCERSALTMNGQNEQPFPRHTGALGRSTWVTGTTRHEPTGARVITHAEVRDLIVAELLDSSGDKVGKIGQIYLDDSTGDAGSWPRQHRTRRQGRELRAAGPGRSC